MKKIPTLFIRDPATNRKHVLNEVTPGCEWVLAGQGVATRKYNGTCCMARDGKLYKRYEWRRKGITPTNFEMEGDLDPVTGYAVGWVPVGDGPEDRWHREAWNREPDLPDGTYELIGPKIQGNPENVAEHELVPHAAAQVLKFAPRDFEGLREYLTHPHFAHEGIVWHHPDGREAKLKTKDFPNADPGTWR